MNLRPDLRKPNLERQGTDLASLHKKGRVGSGEKFLLVDQSKNRQLFFFHVQDGVGEFRAGLGVERGERLAEEKDLGPFGQGPG